MRLIFAKKETLRLHRIGQPSSLTRDCLNFTNELAMNSYCLMLQRSLTSTTWYESNLPNFMSFIYLKPVKYVEFWAIPTWPHPVQRGLFWTKNATHHPGTHNVKGAKTLMQCPWFRFGETPSDWLGGPTWMECPGKSVKKVRFMQQQKAGEEWGRSWFNLVVFFRDGS